MPISILTYGAVADAKFVTDAATTSGLNTLTTAVSTPFASADVGKMIVVAGAGSGGANLTTTISGFVSASHVTLAAAASATLSNVECVWGTNNTTAVNNAITAAVAAAQTVYVPAGGYLVDSFTTFPLAIYGDDSAASVLASCTGNTMFDLGTSGSAPGNGTWTLRDITLRGFNLKSGAGSGLHVYGTTQASNLLVDDVLLYNFGQNAIRIENSVFSSTFRRLRLGYCGGSNFYYSITTGAPCLRVVDAFAFEVSPAQVAFNITGGQWIFMNCNGVNGSYTADTGAMYYFASGATATFINCNFENWSGTAIDASAFDVQVQFYGANYVYNTNTFNANGNVWLKLSNGNVQHIIAGDLIFSTANSAKYAPQPGTGYAVHSAGYPQLLQVGHFIDTVYSDGFGGTVTVPWISAGGSDYVIENDTNPYSVFQILNNVVLANLFYYSFGGNTHLPGTAPPTTNTYSVGDTMWNTAPTDGGVALWRCVTAGTPGTWRPVMMGAGSTAVNWVQAIGSSTSSDQDKVAAFYSAYAVSGFQLAGAYYGNYFALIGQTVNPSTIDYKFSVVNLTSLTITVLADNNADSTSRTVSISYRYPNTSTWTTGSSASWTTYSTLLTFTLPFTEALSGILFVRLEISGTLGWNTDLVGLAQIQFAPDASGFTLLQT